MHKYILTKTNVFPGLPYVVERKTKGTPLAAFAKEQDAYDFLEEMNKPWYVVFEGDNLLVVSKSPDENLRDFFMRADAIIREDAIINDDSIRNDIRKAFEELEE